MRKTGWAVLGLAAVMAAGAAGAPAASAKEIVAGVIIDLKGKPEVRRADDKRFSRMKLNKFVYEGDVIKTEAGERAAVAFIGGAEVRINENSQFVVESGGGRKATSVFTQIGQAWTRLLHGRAGLSVRTPMAVAAVRGTEADVDIHERMTVKVYEGLVDLMNDHGKQSLHAGMMSQVSGAGAAPEPGRKMGPGDYGSWQNGLNPTGVESNLQRLQEAAEKNRLLNLKYKDKDGQPKELNLQLEKK